MEFKDWISEVASNSWDVYIKRLSANDTGATGGHQVGVYIPKPIMAELFPSINRIDIKNPDFHFTGVIDSDNVPEQELRAVYYNGKPFGEGTRNEKRITCWKQGVDYTPIQDEEKTGAIGIFAFRKSETDVNYMRAWVCRGLEEEDYIEDRIGEVGPGEVIFESGDVVFEGVISERKVPEQEYPEEWKRVFPSGKEIVTHLFEKGLYSDLKPDKRVVKRRDHEYDLFKLVESEHALPLIREGFSDVESFIKLANSISNRRKSRSGKSLELHLEFIFREEGLNTFGTQCVTEGNKKPDFLFPGCHYYHDADFPDEKLRVLAVKTTVKDRWRQVLNEADRLTTTYLFTLQEGVSRKQYEEMKAANVKLVVPSDLHERFHKKIRSELYSLSDFIGETKALYE